MQRFPPNVSPILAASFDGLDSHASMADKTMEDAAPSTTCLESTSQIRRSPLELDNLFEILLIELKNEIRYIHVILQDLFFVDAQIDDILVHSEYTRIS